MTEDEKIAVLHMLAGLKRGSCWCSVGIGDPRVITHSNTCEEVMKFVFRDKLPNWNSGMTVTKEMNENDILKDRIERLERIVFLILVDDRKNILGSYHLDSQELKIISDYYDLMRERGW